MSYVDKREAVDSSESTSLAARWAACAAKSASANSFASNEQSPGQLGPQILRELQLLLPLRQGGRPLGLHKQQVHNSGFVRCLGGGGIYLGGTLPLCYRILPVSQLPSQPWPPRAKDRD